MPSVSNTRTSSTRSRRQPARLPSTPPDGKGQRAASARVIPRQRRKHQVLITQMPGAELWLRIEWQGCIIRLPASAALQCLVDRLNGPLSPESSKVCYGSSMVLAPSHLLCPDRGKHDA